MNNLVQHLSLVLPIIAASCVLVFLVINLYFKFRRSFPVRVNCWFCKEWTRVHYNNKNSFDCPTCLQYNGFDTDGGYNKIIPAQHDELLNGHFLPTHTKRNKSSSNGLCRICNNNQQLKIYQLAKFVPIYENDFDAEVEAFRQQLEKAYKLCPVCEHTVKETISKQKKWLGLKLAISKSTSHSYITPETRSVNIHFLNFLSASIILFAVGIMLNAVYNFMPLELLNKLTQKYAFSYKAMMPFVVKPFRNVYSVISSSNYFKMMKNTYIHYLEVCGLSIAFNNEIIKHLPFSLFPKGLEVKHVCIVGFLLQIIEVCLSTQKVSFRRLQVAYWVLLCAISFLLPDRYSIFMKSVQIITSIGILHSQFFKSKLTTETEKLILHKKKISIANQPISSKPFQNSEFQNLSFQSTCDTDTAASDCCSVNDSITSTSTKKETNYLSANNRINNHVFGQPAIFENTLTKIPLSFEELNISTKSVFNESYVANACNYSFRRRQSKDFDLNESLDNLHLSSERVVCQQIRQTPIFVVNKNISRPRPVLSPPKLKTVSQKSWTAGGFWKNSYENLSRSSSQSSGYVSQFNEPLHVDINKFSSLPPSRNSSLCENHERFSLISEPAYHYSLLQQPQRSSTKVNSHSAYNFTRPDDVNYERIKDVNLGLSSPLMMNNFGNRERVCSTFYPIHSQPSNFDNDILTANNLTGNTFCSNSAKNGFGIRNNSTYKLGSLFKPLNETFL